mmetsp:Transcript_18/g.39  ORF Transcript_18/g.39 Transcript_18/m.39 type:complete len:695 (-) Transcript_18:48-2132(-)|eukprot:CAMPEP_0194084512 /NCGR_PEP_ID=MMETSP0149-20130528/13752_1 /TAXON_ID=122233 /ORGANISM="Chaetoceros debilis, Strain MM31A-1" /LENGTH=694 /DNA_ID=CAMNT_0038767187 /DNA_START=167 /DNA_END=2251 /DNA_ORIENTATION=-
MTTFQKSTNLASLQAPTTKSIAFATSSTSNPTESLPTESRWWSAKFHLGPRTLIPPKKSTSSTSVTFQTPTDGTAIISHVCFAPNAIKGNPYQMAIVSGPRVCLYGGTVTSSLSRALSRTMSTATGITEEQEPTSLFGDVDTKTSKMVKPDRNLNTGGEPAHSAAYHSDGRLLAVGCDHGLVRVCDATSRATLRTFATHPMEEGGKSCGLPVRSVGWLELGSGMDKDKVKRKIIYSAGDDATLRIWDLSGDLSGGNVYASGGVGDYARPIATMRGHRDAIRACTAFKMVDSEGEKVRLVTGSYDHSIRVWDCDDVLNANASSSSSSRSRSHMQENSNSDRCLSVMDHGAPVEDLIVIQPTATSSFRTPLILSAGGTIVKLWNPQLGKCLSVIQTKHNKTITSMCLTSMIRGDDEVLGANGEKKKNICWRLVTAGLDGLIRIHSADVLFDATLNTSTRTTKLVARRKNGTKMKKNIYEMPYLHGIKTSLPITAIAMAPDGTKLVVGTTTGYVTVRQRAKYVPQGKKKRKASEPKAGTYAFFMRGMGADADADDHVVQLLKKKKLKKYDVMLQKFRYGDALDEALAARDPNAIVAVLEELGRRRGLINALSNRDEETLEPILAFTATFISRPKYTPILIGVANQLCDIYARVFGQSDTIDEYFEKLHMHVKNECRTQSALNQLIGQIDTVMYAAEM